MARRAELWLQVVTAVLVISYGISIFVAHRHDHYSTFWDGWLHTTAELLPALPAFVCSRRASATRWAWLAAAVAIVLNGAGDLVYTYHDRNLAPVPSIGASSVLYGATAAFSLVAAALFYQSFYGHAHVSVRLDALTTGLALASVAGMLCFEPLIRKGGEPVAIGLEISFPLGDLVVLALIAAVLAPNRQRPDPALGLVLAGMTCFVAANIAYFYQSSSGVQVEGNLLDEIYLVGLFLVGLGATAWGQGSVPMVRAPASSLSLGTLPVGAGLVSLGVLVAYLSHRGPVAVPLLAAVALAMVLARMWVTLKELRSLTAAHYLEARVDHLTGLSNRRALLEELSSALSSVDVTGGQVGLLARKIGSGNSTRLNARNRGAGRGPA
ncbi:MAG: hypothetical protein ACP5VR_13620, partial [Acidimicrobiales bacterium]